MLVKNQAFAENLFEIIELLKIFLSNDLKIFVIPPVVLQFSATSKSATLTTQQMLCEARQKVGILLNLSLVYWVFFKNELLETRKARLSILSLEAAPTLAVLALFFFNVACKKPHMFGFDFGKMIAKIFVQKRHLHGAVIFEKTCFISPLERW